MVVQKIEFGKELENMNSFHRAKTFYPTIIWSKLNSYPFSNKNDERKPWIYEINKLLNKEKEVLNTMDNIKFL